jgi:hypothetical protein
MEHSFMYYDRTGKAISADRFALLYAQEDYRVVAKTLGRNGVRISTIWLGIDHAFGVGEPLIFETMVFGQNSSDLEQYRYSTEAEALKGHEEYVKKYGRASLWERYLFKYGRYPR